MDTNKQAIDVAESEIDEVFAEETGTLVFQSSLMKYISEVGDEEADALELYIEAHASEDNFLDTLLEKYPKFKEIFEQELNILQEELEAVTEGL